MPARQRGAVDWVGDSWRARWYDENNVRRSKAGFKTKTEAWEHVDRKVEEIDALRNGNLAVLRRREMPTLQALVDEYTASHVCEPNTLATLKARLRKATETFGETRVDRLPVSELKAWRKKLPERSAWHVVKALRQVLAYAVEEGLLDANPAKAIPNPEPKRTEIAIFSSLAEVQSVSAELVPEYRPLPMFAALTGLRPEELFALERGDVDSRAKVVHVRRVFVNGNVRVFGKTEGSLRTVPLPLRAAQALADLPPRLDTRVLFPSRRRGGNIDLPSWRRRHWTPAIKAAGLEGRTPYSLRHSYASWSIAAGVNLYELSRHMGTSLEQVSKTYGHLLPDSLDRGRVALDAFIASTEEAEKETQERDV